MAKQKRRGFLRQAKRLLERPASVFGEAVTAKDFLLPGVKDIAEKVEKEIERPGKRKEEGEQQKQQEQAAVDKTERDEIGEALEGLQRYHSEAPDREAWLTRAIDVIQGLSEKYKDNPRLVSKLATYRAEKFGITGKRQISEFARKFRGEAETRRTSLAESMAELNRKEFAKGQPEILEFLHGRGFATSPSTTSKAFAESLEDLESERQKSLLGFDVDVFGQEQALEAKGLEALLGGQQSAVDAATEFDVSGLEKASAREILDRQLAFAGTQGRRNRRNQLLSSLIGFGGQVGSAGLGMF